eukprot:3218801-Amphidinium_carterae.1
MQQSIGYLIYKTAWLSSQSADVLRPPMLVASTCGGLPDTCAASPQTEDFRSGTALARSDVFCCIRDRYLTNSPTKTFGVVYSILEI